MRRYGLLLLILLGFAGFMFHLGMFYKAVKCYHTLSKYSTIGEDTFAGFEYVKCWW
jgi:hypothetical protein